MKRIKQNREQGARADGEWLSTLTRAGNQLLATAKNLEWEMGAGAARRILQLKACVSLARSQ